MERELNDQERQVLLAIARQAILQAVKTGEDYIEPREEKTLNQRNGCFVTIKQNGQLRGCIGNFQSELPLFKEVAVMARASATNDPRFYPMSNEDLENFTLEISVLSPLYKIDNIDEIEVGKHGIYIEKSFYRGVLLPQVAIEHHWDRDTFLKQTCLKAGLPTDAWQAPDADIYIFSAQVFGEEPCD
ncbi:MAG: AmmeMemoRadiSam system protein A [Desulfuromonadales bacterium]|nr:AmmeMemoRadiSam system protein A [Desulfuromonadales bacterium]